MKRSRCWWAWSSGWPAMWPSWGAIGNANVARGRRVDQRGRWAGGNRSGQPALGSDAHAETP
jgi:hypothetical protein